jgi:hypothetical protein
MRVIGGLAGVTRPWERESYLLSRLHVEPNEAVVRAQHTEVSRLSTNLFTAKEVAKGIGADLKAVSAWTMRERHLLYRERQMRELNNTLALYRVMTVRVLFAVVLSLSIQASALTRIQATPIRMNSSRSSCQICWSGEKGVLQAPTAGGNDGKLFTDFDSTLARVRRNIG